MNTLVVERDWVVRDAVKKKLMGLGFTVFTAESAEEAVNLCTAMDVELLVTSADLPEMSGFELADRVVKGRRDLEVACIVLVEREPAFRSFLEQRAGRVMRMIKPVTGEALRNCLQCLKKEAPSEFMDA